MSGNGPKKTAGEVMLERLRVAQAVAHVGSWEIDLRKKTMWASEEAFRIYGLEPGEEQFLPLEVVQSIPLPGFRAKLDHALNDLIAGRGVYDVEFEIFCGDEGVRVVHSRAELLRDDDGLPVAVAGTLQDVTERKVMEMALRMSEERFRMILEHSVDAILLGGADGVITQLNGQACALTGYPLDELKGSHVSILFDKEEMERAPLRFDLLEQGHDVTLERNLKRKDGTIVPVEMHSKKLPDGTYQSIYRDITSRRRLEEQLQLRQRMDSIGSLSSGLAHDFNNILVAIIGYADLLREELQGAPEPIPEMITRLLAASRRAADLIGRLQALSNPEQQGSETFDLYKVASEVVAMLAETSDRRIRVELGIEPETCFIRGGESDIYHALVNLGLNGVQSIETRGPMDGDALRIDASRYVAHDSDPHGLAPGSYVEVRVSDTGEGMSPEVREHAFDPLFSTKPRGVRKGQGLGLTMVYRTVVTGLMGAIDLETEPGKGTVVHLFLPSAEQRPAELAAMSEGEDDVVDSAMILFVEDEAQIVEIARRVLERHGHQVLTAMDGVEGLAQFSRHADKLDLLIIDISLPKLSGGAVMREILRRKPEIGIILSTGNEASIPDDLKDRAEHLPKPYAPADLLRIVERVLTAARKAPAAKR